MVSVSVNHDGVEHYTISTLKCSVPHRNDENILLITLIYHNNNFILRSILKFSNNNTIFFTSQENEWNYEHKHTYIFTYEYTEFIWKTLVNGTFRVAFS